MSDSPMYSQAPAPAPAPKPILPNSSVDLLGTAVRAQSERAKEYDKRGTSERSMERIVKIFNAYYPEARMTVSQGWNFMKILKDVRLEGAPEFHRDSAVDGVSYQSLYAEQVAHEKSR